MRPNETRIDRSTRAEGVPMDGELVARAERRCYPGLNEPGESEKSPYTGRVFAHLPRRVALV